MSFTPLHSSFKGKRSFNSEINVTPFVDVMLVLLIIFMVTSPMLISGVEVELPTAQHAPLGGQDEPIVLTVDRSGDVYLQEDKIPIAQIGQKLRAVFENKKDNRIFIRGDKNVHYGKIMEVFSMLKETGMYNVSLVTEVPKH